MGRGIPLSSEVSINRSEFKYLNSTLGVVLSEIENLEVCPRRNPVIVIHVIVVRAPQHVESKETNLYDAIVKLNSTDKTPPSSK